MIYIVIADDISILRGGLPGDNIRAEFITGWAAAARLRLLSMNCHLGSASSAPCTCEEA
jgi:hypothetical protein